MPTASSLRTVSPPHGEGMSMARRSPKMGAADTPRCHGCRQQLDGSFLPQPGAGFPHQDRSPGAVCSLPAGCRVGHFPCTLQAAPALGLFIAEGLLFSPSGEIRRGKLPPCCRAFIRGDAGAETTPGRDRRWVPFLRGWGGRIAPHGLTRSFPARPYLSRTGHDAST